MSKKRFAFVNPNNSFQEMGCGIKDGDDLLTFTKAADLLNELHEEKEGLKDCEILANHRGEMIDFANALIQDLGTDEMQELWKKFKGIKWKEWREWRDKE